MIDLFIFAGEKSGDLHGEKLLEALHAQAPHLQIAGVGGPKMRAHRFKCVIPMEEFQVMGFIDVFLALPNLIKLFFHVRKEILKLQPKAVVFIDYPGFNLRMAKSLRKKGFSGKLCHYICPSVWAWGKKRIPHMASTLDMLLSILPFESGYFRETGLAVRYVGHPLIQRIKDHPYEALALPVDKTIIGIFPGSRTKELVRNLPMQLRTAKRIKEKYSDLIFALSVSNADFLPSIEAMISAEGLALGKDIFLIPSENTYDLMRRCCFAIAKSGTVTLELALHEVPTVVTFAVKPLDQFIALNILRIRLTHYCLVNIISKKSVFQELIGSNLTEDALYAALDRLISDAAMQEHTLAACRSLKHILQDKDASSQAAQELLKGCL